MTPGTRGANDQAIEARSTRGYEENAGGASRSAATKGKGKAWDRPRVDEAQDDVIETVSICAMSVDADTYVCMRSLYLLSIANPCILHTGDIDIFASFNRKVSRFPGRASLLYVRNLTGLPRSELVAWLPHRHTDRRHLYPTHVISHWSPSLTLPTAY